MREEQQSHGYIYRIAHTDATRLRSLIARYVRAGWTCGGAAGWDFDPERGRGNLHEITPIADAGALDVSGDFGHAFSEDAEVRWKRRDDGGYDVLILSEDRHDIEGGVLLYIGEEQHWRIRRYEQAAIVLADKRAISYIDYLAPNGAVQFQRLVEVL